MNKHCKPLLALAGLLVAASASAQVTFYEGEGFRGRTFSADRPVGDFERSGFNDRASSLIVDAGRWEVCDDTKFRGHCVVVRAGSYDSLRSMGMTGRISSVRPASPGRVDVVPPPPVPVSYEYRRRPSEPLFEVPLTSVRAVMGPPEQRCWTESRQVVTPTRSGPNLPGAVVGGLLGGILGHQVGGGVGKGVATTVGALGGGALGANVGRNGSEVSTQDVRRCDGAVSGPPRYWDVTYSFQGVVHRTQLSVPPGPTILVNADGVPRQ